MIVFVDIVAEDSLQSAVKASANADLTIVGTSREWGLERQTLGIYTDAIVKQCHSSLSIARKYNQINSHINWLGRVSVVDFNAFLNWLPCG